MFRDQTALLGNVEASQGDSIRNPYIDSVFRVEQKVALQ